jgi:hypothetical protein
MGGLRDQFLRFYAPTAQEAGEALRTGLVTPDTNVLLSLYRFQPSARDELFRILEKLGDRLWIPYQVALEFHRNRLNTIAEQENFFGKVREELEACGAEYVKRLRTFSNRVALPQATLDKLIQQVNTAYSAVDEEIGNAEGENQVSLRSRESDSVLARLESLFDGRVGAPMSGSELAQAQKEAKDRIENKIPPGYMDRGKSDPTGDYIIWIQLKLEAARRELTATLITDDRKEDWFWREHGLTLGPRIELYEEMETEAGVRFTIMTTETFLIRAKEYLSAAVSSATVDQAKELPQAREQRQAYNRAQRRVEKSILYEELEKVTAHVRDLEFRRAAAQRSLRNAEESRSAAQAALDHFMHVVEGGEARQEAQAQMRMLTAEAERSHAAVEDLRRELTALDEDIFHLRIKQDELTRSVTELGGDA